MLFNKLRPPGQLPGSNTPGARYPWPSLVLSPWSLSAADQGLHLAPTTHMPSPAQMRLTCAV